MVMVNTNILSVTNQFKVKMGLAIALKYVSIVKRHVKFQYSYDFLRFRSVGQE